MKFTPTSTKLRPLLTMALLCCAGLVSAQAAYPSRPITIVVPFPAAGSTDVLGRILAQSMSQSLKQSVVIENVGGAGGTVGASKVARAQADGHTLLFHNMAQASAPALYAKLPYDPGTDFESIGRVVDVPMILVARKDLAASNLQGVIALAKSGKPELNFANAGVGATSHLCEVLLRSATKSSWLSVPYKGTGPALNDLLGGQVDLICDQPASTIGHIKAGNLKPIATASRERLNALPSVPTMNESGLPGFELSVWHGLYAPKGTPRPVIEKVNAALLHALRDPALLQRFKDMGAIPTLPADASPEILASFLKAEIEKWKGAMKGAGVRAE
ncbi:tripartite tricarboxylate transporter substrate-binding protein [Lacisediminimonas profundi]|uniref:tripartite tricarboxylate transporter substrate-binding protein n=1 Tax=Lacisediminimonas profundi TaxID=2603856 RepID=UPI001F4FC5C0|nr:tripartite tricarboxylate transporter substrate-binding protein [Lacisediminimonas profundi]